MRLPIALATAAFMLAAPTVADAGDYTTQTLNVGVRKNMEATLYTPNGPGPFPQIMVLHTSGGISSFDQGYCGNLAKEGYICIVPAFLRAHGITNETRQMTFTKERHAILEDFRQIGREVLSQHPKAKPRAIGAVGFSNGGYFAALMAGAGAVRAGVSYYGTFTGANTDPHLKVMTAVFKSSSSPLLILAGENDTTIGAETPRKLDAIAKAVGAPCELKMYPATGHDFERSGTTGANNAASAADAWQRTLAFLRANGV